jgi:hypothetical protein
MSDDSWAADDSDSETSAPPGQRPARRISGSGMVFGLLAFGLTTTACMWIYWTLHTGPFRPLQDAIAAAFPHSSPRVEGGQHKMHKGTPMVLRIVMRVDFDPVTQTAHGEEVVDSVEKIASQHVDLAAYDELDVVLFQGVPEQEVRQQEYDRALHPTEGSTKSEKSSQSPQK